MKNKYRIIILNNMLLILFAIVIGFSKASSAPFYMKLIMSFSSLWAMQLVLNVMILFYSLPTYFRRKSKESKFLVIYSLFMIILFQFLFTVIGELGALS